MSFAITDKDLNHDNDGSADEDHNDVYDDDDDEVVDDDDAKTLCLRSHVSPDARQTKH